MSFLVRSVSGRSRVPCPPTRMTAGRLMGRPAAHERGGVWGTGRFPTLSRRRGHQGETWFPSASRWRPRAGGERCSLRGPPDPLVLEAVSPHRRRIEHVAPVDEQPVAHATARLRPVELAELRPFRYEDGRVRALERVERRGGDVDAVEVNLAVRDRVPCAHLGALGLQPTGEYDARGLAHVVGAGLERESEERDLLPTERAEPPLELLDHAPLLQLVHLDDRVQELEAVPRVGGELFERERILWKAVREYEASRRDERVRGRHLERIHVARERAAHDIDHADP